MEDRRAFPRHAVKADGKLILANGSRVLDCVIVDISEGGAQVAVGAERDLPAKVFLWQNSTDAIFDCEVRWQVHKQVGLRIVDTCGRRMRRVLIKACVPAENASRIARWLEDESPQER